MLAVMSGNLVEGAREDAHTEPSLHSAFHRKP